MAISLNLRSAFVGIAIAFYAATCANATETKSYTYDALGRLIAVISDGSVNDNVARTYCYDKAGNRNRAISDQSNAIANCSAPPPNPIANLTIGNASVTEGGTLTFTVTRSGNTSITASASYATTNGTAVAPGDYAAKSGTISFSSGQTSKTITVSTVDDTTVEPDETLRVVLSSPSANTVIDTSSGVGTIKDNDIAPANLAIGNASVSEGGTLSFTVTRSGNTAITASASYATTNGTAVAPGDYAAKSGTISFSSGQTSKTITVSTVDDTAVEPDENMRVVLSSPSANTVITNSSGTGTIKNNDVAPANLAIGNATASEGGTLTFTVTRSGNTAINASASYATINGSAVAPSDYTAKSGTVSFSSGQTTKTITVLTISDTAAESNEAMRVVLSNPSANTVVTANSGVGTINNVAANDMIPIYRFYKYPKYFLTKSYSEGAGSGFTYQSVGFNTYRINASGRRALYRCLNPQTGHFVSIQSTCEGQNQEGTLGYAANASAPNLVPLYRFYNVSTASHLITVNYAEGSSGGFSYEGVLGYVAP
ncbi:Calx-beta domain-containing protein [Erythrobacter sp. SAORIC-644]|uniref:Calx-beta domain-containing protein n=1 Tax=Erythrobacter sp. SAORIC-644 TaxID=1869314 RepID=UPI001304858E|nr:Calx-beta domain-containing protein [Erythrobacter sp. SAORIC-644]